MKNNRVKEYYETEAVDYNKEFYESDSKYPTLRYRQNYILKMIKNLNLPESSVILDAGCGPGDLLLSLDQNFKALFGIDIAEEMISIANKKLVSHKNKNITFNCGDIENLNFNDSQFDIIVCSGVVEYLKDDIIWMKEIKRVLKPDGYLIINVTNKYSVRKWTSGFVEKLKSIKVIFNFMNFIKVKVLHKGKIHYFPFKPRVHSPSKFDKYLINNGFEKITHNYFDFAVLPSPFDTLFGFITTPIKKHLEKYSEKNMKFNGTGYIVCMKQVAR
ncbi:MAG: class I SAM-dependent methyltransferase [Bacteroidales bacterium]|nr:class I SAM-dependent methyltransferase [Bacteroidales bacterium]